MSKLLNLKSASKWASKYLNKDVKKSNISYLIQYGKIHQFKKNSTTYVDMEELKDYYQNNNKTKERTWKKELGYDLNWHLSFDKVREKERTKHVHRLHQYKGKFIPQLVEYFIDTHTDGFKKEIYFQKGDIILDPFCGSGTTLVQANELGIDSIGMDISKFNCLITQSKLQKYDIDVLKRAIEFLIDKLNNRTESMFKSVDFDINNNIIALNQKVIDFDRELYTKMNDFNHKFFPNRKYKYKVNKGEINEKKYSKEKEKEFLNIYEKLLSKYDIVPYTNKTDKFLDKWFMDNIKEEMLLLKQYIDRGKNKNIVNLLKIILSKTIRSCRTTTHSNLAYLKKPQIQPYYCKKHNKICKPLYTLKEKFKRYARSTLKRIKEFDELRTSAKYAVIQGDSRKVDLLSEIKKQDMDFLKKIKEQKVKGIFTSPPYVGQIDYHQQHAYAYELLDLKRKDQKEIGPGFKGKSKEARSEYARGIKEVLVNCKQYLADDADIFIVANDKFNLYPQIFKNADLKIINRFKRPVLNRTSKDNNPYSESIFHVKNIF